MTVTSTAPAAPAVTVPPANGFATLGLDPRLTDALAAAGYSEPTPIQREAIPPLVDGKDLIGLAATGTGKTAAFALPLLHRLIDRPAANKGRVAVMIIAPTRELAVQVATAVSSYGKPLGVRVVPVYGGAGFSDQSRAIRRGADIVVGTPGRILDHIRRGTLDLAGVMAVVLDEADEMLDMGFAEDMDAILSATPATRQTMLFSATMPPRIEAMAAKHLTNPTRIRVAAAVVAAGDAPKVRQAAYFIGRDHKVAALTRVLEFEDPTAAIVFCRTRTEADAISDELAARGHRPDSLHGGFSQEHRDRVMKKFREGTTPLLIATDVAARGLDIGHLSHVVNFGVPLSPETYVHRIGRVGRAGREGVAITVAEPREQRLLRMCEHAAGRKIDTCKLPTTADLLGRRLQRTRDGVRELLLAGGLEQFKAMIAPLNAEYSPEDVAAAAVALAVRAAGETNKDEPEIPVPEMMRPRDARPPRPGFGNDRGFGRAGGPLMGGNTRPTPMIRVFIGVGRTNGIGRRDILDALGNETGLGSRDIGTIDVAERFCVVEVPGEAADHVIEVMQEVRFCGRKTIVRLDRAAAVRS